MGDRESAHAGEFTGLRPCKTALSTLISPLAQSWEEAMRIMKQCRMEETPAGRMYTSQLGVSPDPSVIDRTVTLMTGRPGD